jgi:conjugative transfer signal peptidase TraF
MNGSKLAFIVWGCSASIWAAASLAHSLGLRVNHTASLDVGLWRISPSVGPLPRHSIVSFCPPETEFFRKAFDQGTIGRGHCAGGWEPMLKPVAAVTGDRVEVNNTGMMINGETVPATVRQLAHGEAIPVGVYTVNDDEIWLIANRHPLSFDSRYFGPIPLAQVEGVAKPLLTWR